MRPTTTDWYPGFIARFADEQEFLGIEKPVNRVAPLVSVCIGTYQHAAFIRDCLDSVLMQKTTFPLEVVLGEDASTDGTREICMEYARRHTDRIRLFLRSRERSVFDDGQRQHFLNSRFCWLSARGKYIALCDGDDAWTDASKLQRQVDLLESRPEVSLCGHRAEMGTAPGQGTIVPPAPRALLNTLNDVVASNWIPSASIVLKRSIACEFPKWARALPWVDWPLQVAAAQHGPVAFLNDVMVFYRVHPGGMWSGLPHVRRREQLLLFYDALKCQVPASCRKTIVVPQIARLRRQLVEDYGRTGDRRRAIGAAWAAFVTAPGETVVWLGAGLRSRLRARAERAGRWFLGRVRRRDSTGGGYRRRH